MVKKYVHNHIEVLRQIIDTKFTQALRKKGLGFVELPLLSHHVVTYTVDGQKKYALIVPQPIPDDYNETVYITSEIPADGWEMMMKDVEAQNDGAEPSQMPSRLKVFLEKASQVATNKLFEKYPIEDVFSASIRALPEPELLKEIKYELVYLGYDLEDLETVDSHDVEPKFIEKLIKA